MSVSYYSLNHVIIFTAISGLCFHLSPGISFPLQGLFCLFTPSKPLGAFRAVSASPPPPLTVEFTLWLRCFLSPLQRAWQTGEGVGRWQCPSWHWVFCFFALVLVCGGHGAHHWLIKVIQRDRRRERELHTLMRGRGIIPYPHQERFFSQKGCQLCWYY